MDAFSIVHAQEFLDKLQQCPALRCVLDSFSAELGKKTREDIYVLIKDGAPAKVLKPCAPEQLPAKTSAGEICFVVRLRDPGEIQLLWKKDNGKWKLSNAAKRPYIKPN